MFVVVGSGGARAGVVRVLRLGDEELAPDELDGLAPEHPEPHEPLVLGPLPPPERERGVRHARQPVPGSRMVRSVAYGQSAAGTRASSGKGGSASGSSPDARTASA